MSISVKETSGLRRVTERLKAKCFLLKGPRPYRRGYGAYREQTLENSVKSQDFDVNHLPIGYGRWLDERIVEYPWLLSRLPSNAGVMLDAGSTLNFAFVLTHEIFRGKKLFISTLAPEERSFWDKGISYVYEDLRNSCYKDAFFDWIVSLSTIEHIGLDNTMFYTRDETKKERDPDSYMQAIVEFRRILKPGGVLYVSVPFGRYENRGWLQVFNGEMIDRVLQVFSPRSYIETYFKYSSDGWEFSSRQQAKDASYFDCHGPSEYEDGYPASAGAVACLEMAK